MKLPHEFFFDMQTNGKPLIPKLVGYADEDYLDIAQQRHSTRANFYTQEDSSVWELPHFHDVAQEPRAFLYDDEELESLFHELVEQWIEETGHFSSTIEKVLHPSYQRVIGLGRQVLPLLLHEIQERPNFWFWALKSISGEDPTRPEDRFKDAVDAWLTWGVERGYIVSE